MTLKYNKEDNSDLLVNSILATYGQEVFDQEAGGQEWSLASDETYSQYYTRVGN